MSHISSNPSRKVDTVRIGGVKQTADAVGGVKEIEVSVTSSM